MDKPKHGQIGHAFFLCFFLLISSEKQLLHVSNPKIRKTDKIRMNMWKFISESDTLPYLMCAILFRNRLIETHFIQSSIIPS